MERELTFVDYLVCARHVLDSLPMIPPGEQLQSLLKKGSNYSRESYCRAGKVPTPKGLTLKGQITSLYCL